MVHLDNTKHFFCKAITLFFLMAFSSAAFGQVYTNKEVGKKNQAIRDSLKETDYPYILPIWGQKVTKKGYDLPYSAGHGPKLPLAKIGPGYRKS